MPHGHGLSLAARRAGAPLQLQWLLLLGSTGSSPWASETAALRLIAAAPRPWSAGSVTMAHGLRCPGTCGILVPDQGWNPCLLHCKVDS